MRAVLPSVSMPYGYTYRLLNEADLPQFVEMIREAEAVEPMDEAISLAEMQRWYHHPLNQGVYGLAFVSTRDGIAGPLVGFTQVEQRPTEMVVKGQLRVHPAHRGLGLGRALYKAWEAMARDRRATEYQFYCNLKATLLRDFLVRRGYAPTQYDWWMQLPPESPVESPQPLAKFTIRTFMPGQDIPLLNQARNSTLAEFYGVSPLAATEYLVQEPLFDPQGVFFAWQGDNLAGYCHTRLVDDANTGRREGLVHGLGVLPPYRGAGLGRALLLMGIQHLRRAAPVVNLSVRGHNQRAVALYEGVGFRTMGGSMRMTRLCKDDDAR